MSIKKNFFAPSSKGLGATRRAAMLLAIMLTAAQGAWAWDGSGTAESPYQIKSTADLDQLATDVNNGTTYENKYFVLTADIAYDHTNLGSTESNYEAIGDHNHYFRGHFDGNSKTISGIRIYKGGTAFADYYQGLFGQIGNGAEVKSVILADTRITGPNYTGAIVGCNNGGTVTDCHALADVTVHAVKTYVYYHGGIAGANYGTVTRCTSAAALTTAGSGPYYVGGIVGHNNSNGTVTDCIYLGTTLDGASDVGAIVGQNNSNGTVETSYYTDTAIQGKDDNGTTLGNAASAVGINNGGNVTDVRLATSDDFAVSGDTYTIGTAAGWSVMCAALYHNDTFNRFSGKTVLLGADITVTRMAGGQPFTGTFDGAGNTLTVQYGTPSEPVNQQFVAPFVEVADAAKFTDLTIAGSIHAAYTGSAEPGVGGLIGHLFGGVTIEGCTSTVEITSTRDRVGGFVGLCEHSVSFTDCVSSAVVHYSRAGNISGFVGWSRASEYTISFEGCLFNGKLLLANGQWYGGGFVGWKGDGKTVNITNCLYAPPIAADEKYESGGATFCSQHNDQNPAVITNGYYTHTLGAAQGKQARAVTAGTDVTIDAIALTGDATEYNVSGITAYSGGGLQRGKTLYYGSDDAVSLTLSNTATGAPDGYQYGYTASAGTLSGTTLTMPDQDVTVSVNTDVLVAIDWATVNEGDSEEDPYMIYNKDQLLLLAHRVNGTNGETANDYSGKYFRLGADITFTHPDKETDDYAENYEAIGHYNGAESLYFMGNFDGDGHTVSGIRINKTGGEDANNCQALFGLTGSGADIHDVHLTDARITGYDYVAGIVAYNYGTVSGCTVTDSYITCNAFDHGTICARNVYIYDDRLRNNYYHGCTVNGTPVTSGMGCREADITANHGALPAYAITLGANITTPPGTFAGQTGWLDTPPVGARLAPGNGFTLAGNHYFASGYEFTPGSTLASGAAQGYTPRATLGGQLLDLYTPTGDAPDYTGTAIARLTITADCDGKTLASTQAIYSTGRPVTVAYIKADGTPDETSAIALDGTETSLAAGWYFVGKDISYTQTLALGGDVTLILADGKTMNIGTSESRISGHGIARENGGDKALTIYGQNAGTGALNVYTGNGNKGIVATAVTINGGNVTIDANGNLATGIYAIDEDITINGGNVSVTATGTNAWAIYANCNLTINGGNVNATGGAEGIRTDVGDVTINGGNVSASGTEYGINAYYGFQNIILGWTRPDDRITASSISTPDGGTVAVADGQALTDGSGHIYTGTLTASELSGFAAETTLQPCLALADAADNNAAITDHAGQTLAVALSGRTLYKDGSWNTLCLPFSVGDEEAESGHELDGTSLEGATLMTLGNSPACNTGFDPQTGTLNLDFLPAKTVEPGVAYIVKWPIPDGMTPDDFAAAYAANPDAYDLKNPVFTGVTVTNDAPADHATTSTDGYVTFVGTYGPAAIYTDPAVNLYLGAANKLYWPTATDFELKPFRAYFQLNNGLTAGTPSSPKAVRAFSLNFGEDGENETTGIISIHNSQCTIHNEAGAWYTLDGRKLDGQPTAKGLYIHGGRKVAIK